jgi:hypothetical protein
VRSWLVSAIFAGYADCPTARKSESSGWALCASSFGDAGSDENTGFVDRDAPIAGGNMMSSRLPLGVAVLLLTIVAGNASVAEAWWPPSRLAVLAARQDLRDEVCVALAMDNGRLSPERRAEIMADAKKNLSATELESFKLALDRLSPPPKKVEKTAAQRAAQMAQRSSSSLTRRQATQLLARQTPAGPVIPAGAIQPERMASSGVVR